MLSQQPTFVSNICEKALGCKFVHHERNVTCILYIKYGNFIFENRQYSIILVISGALYIINGFGSMSADHIMSALFCTGRKQKDITLSLGLPRGWAFKMVQKSAING